MVNRRRPRLLLVPRPSALASYVEGELTRARARRADPTVTPALALGRVRCIGTERDAIEAFGYRSELHLWAREFLQRPQGAPVTLSRAAAAPGREGDA